MRMVWGEFGEGADARRASRRRRLRRGAPASAEPKRPAGVFGLRCGVQRGDGSVGFFVDNDPICCYYGITFHKKGEDPMKQMIFLIIAVILGIAATVLAFILIVPEKRRENQGAFCKFLHDLCNFRFLVVEKVLQALYIFSTAFVILYGVLQLFNVQPNYWTGGNTWMGGVGLLYIILGPIVVRLSFEMMMMVILLVKNVISINHKLASQSGSADGDVFGVPDMQELKDAARQRKAAAQAAAQAKAAAQAAAQEAREENVRPAQFCSDCGTKLENGVCPHCSTPTQEQ